MQTQRFFIGIDGGGTHSYGVTVNDAGTVLATAQSGSLNFHGGGLARARHSLSELVHHLTCQLPAGRVIEKFIVGSAALFIDSTALEKEQLCAKITPLERTQLIGDCLTAYHGACLSQPGVLVIAGTGSIVLARNEEGEFSQGGGWGHIFGDAGSAWWIALESTRAAIAEIEGLGAKTSITAAICQFFCIAELKEIIPIVYDAGYPKDKFAALAGFLFQHVGTDEVFQEICCRGGRELAGQALATIQRAHLNLNPLPLFLAGSVLEKNELVRESLIAGISRSRPVESAPAKLRPLLGAALLALEAGGITATPNLIENLRKTHHEFSAKKLIATP